MEGRRAEGQMVYREWTGAFAAREVRRGHEFILASKSSFIRPKNQPRSYKLSIPVKDVSQTLSIGSAMVMTQLPERLARSHFGPSTPEIDKYITPSTPPALPLDHRASNCTILPTSQHQPHVESSDPRFQQTENSPLRPLLIEHPMSTLLAPDRITQVQGHLARALPAHICHGRDG